MKPLCSSHYTSPLNKNKTANLGKDFWGILKAGALIFLWVQIKSYYTIVAFLKKMELKQCLFGEILQSPVLEKDSASGGRRPSNETSHMEGWFCVLQSLHNALQFSFCHQDNIFKLCPACKTSVGISLVTEKQNAGLNRPLVRSSMAALQFFKL